jgi:hypothetical protein
MNNITDQYLSYQTDCVDCGNKPCDTLYNDSGMPTFRTNVCTNSGFNYGYSSNLTYDPEFIRDDIEQSTAPLMSILDPNRVKNCSQCLSLNGPRASHNGWGNSIPVAQPSVTPAQDLIDIDSIMSNRNVKQDRSKKGHVNMVDVFKFKTYDAKLCDRGLDPLNSSLTYPKQLYREMSINRFYDLNINPQVNIFYDWAVNSQLEAKDNFDYPYPFFLNMDESLPKPIGGKARPCKTVCKANCDTKVYSGREWDKMQEQSQQECDSDSESESRPVRSESFSDSDSEYGY